MDETIAILTFAYDTCVLLLVCIVHTYQAFCYTFAGHLDYAAAVISLLDTPELFYGIITTILVYSIGFILAMWLVIYMLSSIPTATNLPNMLFRVIKNIRILIFTSILNLIFKFNMWVIKFFRK